MTHLTGSLGPTASYARREYAFLNLGNDGRDATIFLNSWHAQRRHNTAVFTSTYSIGEVEEQGFAGRVFILDKLTGEDEHERKPGDRKPPYRVYVQERTADDGEITTLVRCECMAAGCNAPCCRHSDLTRELLAQGAFDETQTEYDYHHGSEARPRTEQEANRSPRDARPYADRDGEEARREAPRLPVLRERGGHARAGADPHFVDQTEPLLTNSRTISEFS